MGVDNKIEESETYGDIIMRLSIREKMMGSAAFILIAMAIVGWRGIEGMRDINKDLNEIKTNQFEPARAIANANIALISWNCAMLNHVLAESSEKMDEYERIMLSQKAVLLERLQQLSGVAGLSDREKELVRELRNDFSQSDPIRDRVVKLSRAGKQEEARHLIRAELRPIIDKMGADMTEFLKLQENQLDEILKATDERYLQGLTRILLIIGTSIAASILIFFFLSTSVMKGVNELVRGAKMAAEGDLAQAKVTITSKDEFGYLGAVFNQMLDSLARSISEFERVQANLLSRNAELKQYRKHLEELVEERTSELRDSEQRLRNLMETVPMGIGVSTPGAKGTVTEGNSTLWKTFGYDSKDEYLNLPASVHYCDPKERERFSELREQGPVVNYETRFKRKDGTVFWGSVCSVTHLAEAGTIQFINTFEDITERKWREEEILRPSKVLDGINKVLREALTCESDKEVANKCLSVAEEITGSKFGLIGEVNPAGRFDTIAISNPGWDVCKMPDSEATRLIQNMKIRGIDRSVIREGRSRIVNDPASHPDRVGTPEGHPPITSFLGVPLKQADKTVGMIGLGNKESGYDLADQEAIEDLSIVFLEALIRKRAAEALNRERERFQILVEESPLGVSLIGKDGDYKYINPKFIEIFGYTLKDIPTGREWFRKAFPDPKNRKQVISTWISDLKKVKSGDTRPRTFTVTCKDGSKRVIQFLPVMMKAGDHLVIYEDITAQRKLESQLIQTQKMEAIGLLAGGVAHDFNNLLTTIIGNASLLLMRLDEEDPLHEDIEEIKSAGDRAASLTRQLLAFSRKQPLHIVVLNFNEVITDMSKMLKRLIGEYVKVEAVFKPDLMKVKADPGQMEQIIMNLAINAKDAMPRGGKLTIETANVYLDETYWQEYDVEAKPGHYVLLALSDTGMGMDKETNSHIFEPFFTTKEKGVGTGIGLSTVYGIVKQMGGYIWVYSEPGQGTTFKIYLPGVESEAEPVKREPALLEGFRGSETVLLVEDDKSLLNLARKVFRQSGYNVLEAQNGEDALKVVEEHEGPIHLILTDVVMPEMNGRELAERIMLLFPEIKVIYMSGYTDNAISHHGVLEPGVNFIEKPFTPESLMRKIREVLDQKIDD